MYAFGGAVSLVVAVSGTSQSHYRRRQNAVSQFPLNASEVMIRSLKGQMSDNVCKISAQHEALSGWNRQPSDIKR